MKRALGVAAALSVLLVVAPGAHGAPTTHAVPNTKSVSPVDTGGLNSDAEAFGVRVEYDIPAPAGSGTVPHVTADTNRHNGSDSAHGIAAAPTQLDAVVAGEYVDPGGIGGGKPMRNLPQTECYYPGQLLSGVFRFPTNTQAETAQLPAISVSTSQCSSGPYAELHASDLGIGTPDTPTASLAPVLHSGMATADAITRPVHHVLISDASAHVSDLNVLGVIHIGSVIASSHSETTATPGGGKSSSAITLSDMTIAGIPVSLAHDQLSVAGVTAPVASVLGQALVDQLNNTLSAVGCTLTLLARPARYPQGFLLARQPPKLGVAADGSLAASMVSGVQLLCNVPQAVTSHLSNFSPQRMQIVIGFAYTSVGATSDPGGFGIGDLGGTPPIVVPTVAAPTLLPPSASPNLPAAPTTTTAPAYNAAPSRTPQLATPIVSLGHYKLDPTTRALLFAGCAALWLVLTVLAMRAVRGVTAG